MCGPGTLKPRVAVVEGEAWKGCVRCASSGDRTSSVPFCHTPVVLLLGHGINSSGFGYACYVVKGRW